MGDELEARVEAEPAKDESEFSSSVARDQDTDMLTQPTGSSNNKELRGQQDYHDISPSHRDVEPLTQTANSETGTTESSVDSDYILSDSLTSTDEEAEHSVGEETEHSEARKRHTNRRDYMLRLCAWMIGCIVGHGCSRYLFSSTCTTSNEFEKHRRLSHRSKLPNASSSTVITHCLLYTRKKRTRE